jgi:hypothetical protein
MTISDNDLDNNGDQPPGHLTKGQIKSAVAKPSGSSATSAGSKRYA